MENVEYGGTGFFYDKAPKLPDEIEHCFPDYHLYDEFVNEQIEKGVSKTKLKEYIDFSIGFTTRGCIRGCDFCVNKNCTQSVIHSKLAEFVDPNRKYICLLDDNVFACKHWKQIFEELINSGKRFCYKQGMDERLLTDEKCEYLFNKSNYYGDYTFAFDNIKDREIIEKKLKMIRNHTNKQCRFYVLCAFNHDNPDNYSYEFWKQDIIDTFERIKILIRYKCIPYIMRYKDYEISPYRGVYITLARWCIQVSLFKKKSIREFARMSGENSSAMKYLTEFENEHPDIAAKYFDMKFDNEADQKE